MMLVGKWPSELERIVSFKWSALGFRYLGVMITPDISQLYNANYGKLITQIRADLERWKILPLSLFGRIETIKMNILPRLLYLFQTLPVWISSSVFKMLDGLISSFLWQKKKPRVRLKQLTWPKRLGGLDLPNLKLYFWAAQLRAMVEWLLQNEETNWLELEKDSCATIPLEALPFLDKKTQSKFKIKNDWIKCTQRVWNTVKKKIGAPLESSRTMKISGLMNFEPNKLDVGFKEWGKKGLILIHQGNTAIF